MNLFRFKTNCFPAIFVVFMLLLSSCASKQDIVYFQNAKNFETIVDTDTFTPRFKVNDIVSIFVSAFDLEAVKPFNLIKGAEENSSRVGALAIQNRHNK